MQAGRGRWAAGQPGGQQLASGASTGCLGLPANCAGVPAQQSTSHPPLNLTNHSPTFASHPRPRLRPKPYPTPAPIPHWEQFHHQFRGRPAARRLPHRAAGRHAAPQAGRHRGLAEGVSGGDLIEAAGVCVCQCAGPGPGPGPAPAAGPASGAGASAGAHAWPCNRHRALCCAVLCCPRACRSGTSLLRCRPRCGATLCRCGRHTQVGPASLSALLRSAPLCSALLCSSRPFAHCRWLLKT